MAARSAATSRWVTTALVTSSSSPVIALGLQLALTRHRLLLMAFVVDRHGNQRADVPQELVALTVRPSRDDANAISPTGPAPLRGGSRQADCWPKPRNAAIIRVFGTLVKAVEDHRRGTRFDEGSQARLIERRNGHRLNLRRRRRAVGRFNADGFQLRGSPSVMRNDHAKHVEVGDRSKRGGQRRQELAGECYDRSGRSHVLEA